jgi:hypothetical protein
VKSVGLGFEIHGVLGPLMNELISLVVLALLEDVYEDFVMCLDRLTVDLIDRFYLRFSVEYQRVFDDYFLDEIF